MNLKAIGFWPTEYDDEPPYFLLNNQKTYNQLKIAAYLNSGFKLRSWLGYSFCRFHCGIPDKEMGVWDLTDGVWVWPEGFVHYIDFHNIILPEDFVQHIQKNNYKLNIPTNIEKILLSDKNKFHSNPSDPNLLIYDGNSWRTWLQQQKNERKVRTEDIKIAKYSKTSIRDNIIGIPDDDSFLDNN